MAWDPVWDDVFNGAEWGKYPPEELVRFIARNFYGVSDKRKVRILEIGCGPGANITFLAREGFSATGIDGSAVAIQRAGERLKAENLTADIHIGDAAALPFGDQQFDCVIDVVCLACMDFDDTKRILSEAHRVLKPQGVIFSMNFATGMTGEETAIPIEGKPNCYSRFVEGALSHEMGLIRLLPEEKIFDLYEIFSDLKYDYLIRSDKNRAHIVKEWIVSGRKRGA